MTYRQGCGQGRGGGLSWHLAPRPAALPFLSRREPQSPQVWGWGRGQLSAGASLDQVHIPSSCTALLTPPQPVVPPHSSS